MNASSSPHFIALNEIASNHPATLNTLQAIMVPYISEIATLWLALWCTVAVIVLWRLAREIREQRKI